jgi:hypothetical protein
MVTYAEHDSDDAEDDGEEARVVDGQSWGDSFGGAYGFAVDGCLGSLPPANAPPHDDDPSFISLSLSPLWTLWTLDFGRTRKREIFF